MSAGNTAWRSSATGVVTAEASTAGFEPMTSRSFSTLPLARAERKLLLSVVSSPAVEVSSFCASASFAFAPESLDATESAPPLISPPAASSFAALL